MTPLLLLVDRDPPVLHLIFPTKKSDPELAPFRSGLVFGFFNALTWQVALATPLVLFAQQLGATPFQVGLATSFVLLLTPIQILSTALLPVHGFRRVMLGGWGARSLFLIVPIVLAALVPWWGVRSWMSHVLVWSVFFFCLCRSVGAASFTPWIYAIVPVSARGRYFANDQFVSSIGGVATLLVCAGLFALMPVFTALLVQYAIALIGSTLSFFALKQLPDGPRPTAIALGQVVRDTPRHMFAPGAYRSSLWISVWYCVLSTPIPGFIAYYLAVVPKVTASQIMAFEVVRYSGVFLTAWAIRRRIDARGAKPFFQLSLGLYVLVGGYWWARLHFGMGGPGTIYGAYFVLGVAATCWTIANLNYLPKVVAEAERPLMVSIHGAVTSCIGGLAPMALGWLLKPTGAEGPAIALGMFEWFFVSVVASAVVLVALVARLPEDTSQRVEPLDIGSAILRPLRAVSYLASLIEQPTGRSWERREKGGKAEETDKVDGPDKRG